jgi:hypothetical protein
MAGFAGAAIVVGLAMTVLALNSDLMRMVGFQFRNDPSDRMRGWKSASAAVEETRTAIEAELGQPVFMIADERARASEFAFYFRDKRVEGPGHPPVYIVESQDVTNQFSFWPRYDEFVEAPPGAPRPEGDVYTEESGVNPFTGRTALFIQANGKGSPPRNVRAAFESTEPVRTIEVRRYGRLLRKLTVFVCKNYRTLPL